jgi:hypothetical protein
MAAMAEDASLFRLTACVRAQQLADGAVRQCLGVRFGRGWPSRKAR